MWHHGQRCSVLLRATHTTWPLTKIMLKYAWSSIITKIYKFLIMLPTNLTFYIVTFIQLCQSCVFSPENSEPSLVNKFFNVAPKPEGNLMLFIVSMMFSFSFDVKIHGAWTNELFSCNHMFGMILTTWRSFRNCICASRLVPFRCFHKHSATFFPMCIVSNRWAIDKFS